MCACQPCPLRQRALGPASTAFAVRALPHGRLADQSSLHSHVALVTSPWSRRPGRAWPILCPRVALPRCQSTVPSQRFRKRKRQFGPPTSHLRFLPGTLASWPKPCLPKSSLASGAEVRHCLQPAGRRASLPAGRQPGTLVSYPYCLQPAGRRQAAYDDSEYPGRGSRTPKSALPAGRRQAAYLEPQAPYGTPGNEMPRPRPANGHRLNPVAAARERFRNALAAVPA